MALIYFVFSLRELLMSISCKYTCTRILNLLLKFNQAASVRSVIPPLNKSVLIGVIFFTGDSNSDTKWYFVVIVLICGMFIGMILL